MRKIFITLVVLVAGLKTGFAQESLTTSIAKAEFQAKQVIPPSPIAAELGRYGNVPVGLFTGTPNISIPLAELTGTLLSLPVSLSYNASGFRPEDPATWAGSGWSLNAGGVVTRAVKGNPDNASNYFTTTNPLLTPLSTITPNVYNYYDIMRFTQAGLYETQPDMYYYNFLGYSGRFLLKPDQTVVKKKRDMLKITPGILSGSGNFSIQDENGNIYTFSDREITTTQPMDEVGQANGESYTYPSAWFLTKIKTADGTEEINFQYHSTAGQTIYPNNSPNQSSYYSYGTRVYGETGGAEYSCMDNTSSGGYTGISPTSYITRKFLSNITFIKKNAIVGSVDFISAAGQRQDSDFAEDRLLNDIIVKDKDGNPVKKYTLNYSYFINNNNTFTKKRLRLDAVQEVPLPSGIAKPPYQFTYNYGTSGSSLLPERFTKSLDHWGFYNRSGNTSLVPTVSVLNYFNNWVNVGLGANRDPDFEGASLTMLNKIQYPTGGYTTFEYEKNRAALSSVTSSDVGGLRIKSIADYSNPLQLPVIKQYYYTFDDGNTSGSATIPEYLTTTTYSKYRPGGFCTECEPCAYTTRRDGTTYTVSANSIYGLGTFQGSYVGYHQVTEQRVSGSTYQPIGKTVYKYKKGFADEFDDDAANGDLLYKGVYDSNNKLLSDETNLYRYERGDGGKGYIVKPELYQSNQDVFWLMTDGSYSRRTEWNAPTSNAVTSRRFITQFYIQPYTMWSEYGRLLKKTQRTYDQLSNSYKMQADSFVYENPVHMYATKIIQKTNGNSDVVTLKKYAGDYTFSGTTTDTAANAILKLKQNNRLGAEIESTQFRQNADGSNKRYVSGSVTTYLDNVNTVPYKTFNLETAMPLSALTPSDITSGGVFTYDVNYKPAGTFKFENNNVIEQYKVNGPVSAYIWNYGQTKPVAAVVNARRDEIAYTSFEDNTTGNNWALHQILLNTTTSFSGKTSGVLGGTIEKSFATAPSQLILTYWASAAATVTINNSVVVPVTTQGMPANGWTYFEHVLPEGTIHVKLSGSGISIDELRLYPKKAQMQTVNYADMIGVSSEVSASNDATHYEYDGYARLKNVRNYKKEIIKNYDYNYGPGISFTQPYTTLFYNAAVQQSFTKQGCTAGTPEVMIYKVPYGKHRAATQAAADLLAQQDISANGQAYANTYGRCLFYNTQVSKKFFRNNCPVDQGVGLFAVYVVFAGKHAAESQAAADALAQTDLNTNGQTYANETATCSCSGEGKKMINGNCETGTKIYVSSTGIGGGQYQCVYRYVFSDSSVSDFYTIISNSPCVNN